MGQREEDLSNGKRMNIVGCKRKKRAMAVTGLQRMFSKNYYYFFFIMIAYINFV